MEKKQLPVDVDVYGMDDNLHMHDLKHKPLGDSAGRAREAVNERRNHLRHLLVPDADGHADLDLARPDGADFLFTMTEVPLESVALKLFTGIEKFEIMAIPFFILAGNFLTHGGVAKRMINFATSMVGHWYGGLGLAA
jgi:hypothetical protein